MRIATRATVGILLLTLSTAVLASGDYEAGMNAFKAGKYAEAAAEFQALVDQSPSYDFGYYMLGLSFFKMKKLDEAADNISKSLELNGDKFQYHHALASVKRSQRRHPEAIRILNGAEGLVDNRGIGFIATHDLELAKLAQQVSSVRNFHFRDQVVDQRMAFDYKLHTGPCPTTNALKIMEMEGLPI